MAKKCYIVKKGRVPGIYFTWADCQAQVSGFTGAVFNGMKEIPSKEEMLEMLKREGIEPNKELLEYQQGHTTTLTSASSNTLRFGEQQQTPRVIEDLTKYIVDYNIMQSGKGCLDLGYPVDLWVDGSFNQVRFRAGSGIVIEQNGEVLFKISFGCLEPELLNERQVTGEIIGAVVGLQLLKQSGIKMVRLHYDYMGIGCWLAKVIPQSGITPWSTNKTVSKSYSRFLEREIAGQLNVELVKFDSHVAETPKLGREVDKLARVGALVEW